MSAVLAGPAASPGPDCAVCGASLWHEGAVLWPGLVAEWQLSPAERALVDRQQGARCDGCGANPRSSALARAVLEARGAEGTLAGFVASPAAAGLRVLEVNEAGTLHPVLARLPGHVLAAWPEADLHDLPFADAAFDLVLHSDTLEHVEHPVRALAECRRVLRPGGALCFTVPILVGRMTRGRAGLPPSYHGAPGEAREDFRVHTEYGADAWTGLMEAGFRRVGLTAAEYPAALALTGFR